MQNIGESRRVIAQNTPTFSPNIALRISNNTIMSFHKLTAEEKWNEIEKQTQNDANSIRAAIETLFDVNAQLHEKKKTYSNNIENFIGTVKVCTFCNYISYL